MNDNKWYKVDNVAKVFLATHNSRDTRTLRVCCTLTDEVNPEILQQALLSVIQSRKLFQVRIRHGLFWHYMEPCEAIPHVEKEHQRPCPDLYGRKYRGLLHYSVTYYGKRINVEIFHALTDGTGAFEFLNLLVTKYLKLSHPEELRDFMATGTGARDELEENSYSRFFEKNDEHTETGESQNAPGEQFKKAYHIHGGKLPYDQLQFFEVHADAAFIKERAKSLGVGLTGLVGAYLMQAIYRDMPLLMRKLPICISMPVNLRNYYPSETARNFFVSINVTHRFDGSETTESLAREFETQMKEKLKPEAVRSAMNTNQQYEQYMAVRVVPLAIKQLFIRYRSRKNSRKCSAVISNLGILKSPEALKPYIESYSGLCSHEELFMTLYTYEDHLCLGITSGYRNTSVLKNFIREFSSEEHPVTIYASEVTHL